MITYLAEKTKKKRQIQIKNNFQMATLPNKHYTNK